jgi:predicted TIM-barrel fold metal-dependent hydrolase
MKSPGASHSLGSHKSVRAWDCHVHCYPDEVARDPGKFAQRYRETHWLELVTTGPQGWADPEQLVAAMDRDGVEKVLLQAWYWQNPETSRLQNEWHAEWIERFPDRLMACAAIHPEDPDPVGQLEGALQWGACGVGECLPAVQSGSGWDHPAWETILAWTARQGWPMCVHVTEPVGHAYPGRVETCLMEMVGLFERHPSQKWICAHWGGGLPFHALNKRVRKALANVWFDTAAGPLLYSPRIWHIACELIGAGKILFGSDFPLRLYPSKEAQPGWKRFLHELENSGLSEQAQSAILNENLAAILEGTNGKRPI